MTTAPTPDQAASARLRYLSIGAAAAVAHLVMMIPGYHDNGAFQTTEWVSMLLVSLVLGAALFWFAVPGGGAVTALVLGVVAVVSLLVVWAGVTLPIAAAGAVVGWRGRESAEQRGLATWGLALSALAAVALVAIIVGDGLSN